jgi:hypothetical protein
MQRRDVLARHVRTATVHGPPKNGRHGSLRRILVIRMSGGI